jgi:hypothetical protein
MERANVLHRCQSQQKSEIEQTKGFQAKNNHFHSLESLKMEIFTHQPTCGNIANLEWKIFSVVGWTRGRHILPYSIAISLSCPENVSACE